MSRDGSAHGPLWDWATTAPDRIAIRATGREWTYAQASEHASRFAARLRAAGVRRGDRVLLVEATTPEFVVAQHGILAAGCVAVTVNPQSSAPELEHFVDDAGCVLAVTGPAAADTVRRVAEAAGIDCWGVGGVLTDDRSHDPAPPVVPSPDDPAVLLYTSGTSGRPKGAVLTHANISAATRAYAEVFSADRDDRFGTALPLFHVFGQVAVVGLAFRAGASVSLLPAFDAAALLARARDDRLTVLSGVPTMWIEMLHAETDVTRADLSAVRLASSGGAAMPRAVALAFQDRFGVEILDGYGLSETTSVATVNRLDRPAKEGSVGRALPGVEIIVAGPDGSRVPAGQPGEVMVRGPVVMREYWGQPAATAAATRGGWFATGDVGRLDEEGDLWILDRTKDLVIRGGYNVYPREVEDALYRLAGVREAAVIGVPDDRLGEEIAAVVVVDEASGLTPQDLRRWLEGEVARYKVPRLYQLVDSLPRGSTGKILKRSIDRGEVLGSAVRAAAADRAGDPDLEDW